MKISSSGHIQGEDPLRQKSAAKGVEKQGSANASREVSSKTSADQINISDRAREIARISEIVRTTPDTRINRVEALKRAIDSGTYKMDSQKVAGRLLNDIREESSL
jgi:negative regulator of flagellin synthesis FlgM